MTIWLPEGGTTRTPGSPQSLPSFFLEYLNTQYLVLVFQYTDVRVQLGVSSTVRGELVPTT
jgi:hypothetical protein